MEFGYKEEDFFPQSYNKLKMLQNMKIFNSFYKKNIQQIFKSTQNECRIIIQDDHTLYFLLAMLEENQSSVKESLKIDRKFNLDKEFDTRFQEQINSYKDKITVIFFSKSNLDQLTVVIQKLTALRDNCDAADIHLVLQPMQNKLSIEQLKQRKINQLLKESNIHWILNDFIALSPDLISLEHYNSQLHLRQNSFDHDINDQILTSLDKIQRVQGKFEFIHQKGTCAQQVKENQVKHFHDKTIGKVGFEHLVIFDRSVDQISLMLKPSTFGGILNEEYDITHNLMYVDPKEFGQEVDSNDALRPIQFDTRNEDFATAQSYVRDCPIFLFQKVKSEFDKKKEHLAELNRKNNEIKEMSVIVALVKAFIPVKNNIDKLQDLMTTRLAASLQMPFYQLMVHQEKSILDNEININVFFDQVINAVNVKLDINLVLRLLSIYSVQHDGIIPQRLDLMKQTVIRNYGLAQIYLFDYQEELELIQHAKNRYNFLQVRNQFKLQQEDSDFESVSDSAFSLNVWASLSTRLLESLFIRNIALPFKKEQVHSDQFKHQGWKTNAKGLNMILGPQGTWDAATSTTEEYKQQSENVKGFLNMFTKVKQHELPPDTKIEKSKVLILYLGGLTEAEISSVRYLNQIQDKFEFQFMTTEMLTANKFFNNLNKPKDTFQYI